jgi:nascent polypeptide-associated complex subunit alpha
MIPGVNPRQVQQMMKQMGMSQEDLDCSEVIIKTSKGNLVFSNPSVQKIIMQGQENFQLSGEYTLEENKLEISISDEDIETVSSQANVSKEKAKEALSESDGDIAQAIVNLSE